MVTETPVTADAAEGAGIQDRLLVEFELDGESYGVDIGSIREIIRYQTVTVLPGAPDIVEGIINLRGRVTPIVDLRRRLNLSPSEVNDSTRIIVIEVDHVLVGVHVDAVTGVINLNSDQVQPLSGDIASERSSYLEGVADLDGRLVVLINLQEALDSDVATAAPSPETVAPANEAAATAPAEPESTPAGAESEATSTISDLAPADDVIPTVEDEPLPEPATEGDAAALGLRVDLLEQSFEAVKPQAEALVARFYENLFTQHPGVQPLFAHVDPAEQQGKLLSALATVVASLRQPDVLVPHLEELGRRHVAYGAEPAHYEAVGTVLVETLGEIAGDLWTDEFRDAWSDALSLVATVMIDAAAQSEASTPAPGVESIDEVAVESVAMKRTPRKSTANSAPRKSAAKATTARKPAAKKSPAAKKPATTKSQTAKKTPTKPAAKKRTARKKPTGSS